MLTSLSRLQPLQTCHYAFRAGVFARNGHVPGGAAGACRALSTSSARLKRSLDDDLKPKKKQRLGTAEQVRESFLDHKRLERNDGMEFKTARQLVKEFQGRERSPKVIAKMAKAQARKERRDREYRKMAGEAPPPSRAHTAGPHTGTISARENAKQLGMKSNRITDDPEADLPPPGQDLPPKPGKGGEGDGAGAPGDKLGLGRGVNSSGRGGVKRDAFVPLVFGSRTRKVTRSYQRLVDQLRTRVGKMKTKHPLQVVKRGMSADGNLPAYIKRIGKLQMRDARTFGWLKENSGINTQENSGINAQTTANATEKGLAIPEKPKNASEMTLRKKAELYEVMKALDNKPMLKHIPTDAVKAESYLRAQQRLETLTYDQRHMPSDRFGNERTALAMAHQHRAAAANSRDRQSRFFDSVRIAVVAGRGGDGRQKSRSIGGDGGNVYIEAVEGVSLDAIGQMTSKKFKSQPGGLAAVDKLKGRRGNDLIISVPVGTVVSPLETANKKVSDLDRDGQRMMVAKGGAGGSVFTDPAWQGQPGQRQPLRLELKMLADVGLVGFPNAGKSTLLSRVSKCTPKIAAYPFTTVRPQIGMVNYLAGERVSIADLPGLIEGAHCNVGLGHRFLRHLERCKVLLYLVDINGFQLSIHDQKRDPVENIDILAQELELYKEGLSQRPAILCVTKMDTPGAVDKCKALMEKLKDYMVDGATMPDLDTYRDYQEEDPILDKNEVLKYLPGGDDYLERPLVTREGPFEPKPMAEIDAGEVLDVLSRKSRAGGTDILVTDFPVANSTRDHAGDLDAEIHSQAREILDEPIDVDLSTNVSTRKKEKKQSLSTGLTKTDDVVARAKKQRSQLRSLAMGFEHESSMADETAQANWEAAANADGGIESDLNEEEKSLLSMGERRVAVRASTSLSTREDQESRLANNTALAVHRPKPQIKFQQVIPISCHRELQGLDFLYISMRGVVKAAKRHGGPRINFTEQLVREEENTAVDEEADEARRYVALKDAQ